MSWLYKILLDPYLSWKYSVICYNDYILILFNNIWLKIILYSQSNKSILYLPDNFLILNLKTLRLNCISQQPQKQNYHILIISQWSLNITLLL